MIPNYINYSSISIDEFVEINNKIISIEKEKYLELKCYKRNRFLLNLPIHGQRNRSNAKTRRKLKN